MGFEAAQELRIIIRCHRARGPQITGLGLSLGFIVGGALLTEVVFSYPGIGYQLLVAVNGLDYPLMQGIFLTITSAVLIANFLVDIAYVRLDPRVRTN